MLKNKITNLETAKRLVEALRETVLESKRNNFFGAFKNYFKDRSDFDACVNGLGEEKTKITELGFFYSVVLCKLNY
jgi:hypothetical protein